MNPLRQRDFFATGLILASFLFPGNALAEKADNQLVPIDGELTPVLRKSAMPQMKESRLGKILNRFYAEGLGGPENWDRIKSLRVTGKLTTADGESEFHTYQKKPNLVKVTVTRNGRDFVQAYDGKIAWQIVPGKPGEPESIDEEVARRFIHGADFGNHLLFPFAEGKTYEYLETEPVDGIICHKIRVSLDTGFQIEYFIDIRTFLEIKVVTKDLKSGVTDAVVYEDYTEVSGVPIPRVARCFENDEWVSTFNLEEVKINPGIMPWMFSMPET